MVDDVILLGAMFLFLVFVVGSIVHYVDGEIEYYKWKKKKEKNEKTYLNLYTNSGRNHRDYCCDHHRGSIAVGQDRNRKSICEQQSTARCNHVS